MAVTFEEAKQIAKKNNSSVNACQEFGNAYRFYQKNSTAVGDSGVVVMKASGSTKNYANYIMGGFADGKPKAHPMTSNTSAKASVKAPAKTAAKKK